MDLQYLFNLKSHRGSGLVQLKFMGTQNIILFDYLSNPLLIFICIDP
jgi:hypothetical protein